MIRLVVVALLVAGCSPLVASTPAPRSDSDAQITSLMTENIGNFTSVNAHVHRNGTAPDVYAKDGIVYVAVLVPKGSAADALCQSISAMTNDPNTGKPLGVRAVVLIAGRESLATCYP